MFDEFHFSYSSLNAFETCKFQFKLSYIDKEPRVGNFFSDYGSLCHDTLEKYFSGELEIFELMDYFIDQFEIQIKNSPPPFLKIYDSYKESGIKFFENFEFDRSEYEIVNVEEYIKGSDRNFNIVIKPDLILTNKETHDTIIFDFKTSEIEKNGIIDQDKLDGYKKQINFYIYYIWLFKGIEINKAQLWFIRSNTNYQWDYNQDDITDILFWVSDVVSEIKNETKWEYNNKNKFFCNNLCGVRLNCPYRKT